MAIDKAELLALLDTDPEVRAKVRDLIGDIITQEPPPASPAAVAALKSALLPAMRDDLKHGEAGVIVDRRVTRPGWINRAPYLRKTP